MTEGQDSGRELGPVKFSRLARRGLMLGLSLPQVIVLGVGAVAIIGALYTAGGKGLLLVVPVIGVCAALVWVPVGGHKLIEWIPLAGHWALRAVLGQTVYRWRVTKPRPAGTLALPCASTSIPSRGP